MPKIKTEQILGVGMRTPGDVGVRNYGQWRDKHFLLEDEWKDTGTDWANRDGEETWEDRYQWESSLAAQVISENEYKSVLELGSGPGKLSDYIHNKLNYAYTEALEYHLIDKKYAKERFKKRRYRGKFFVKDLFNSFDISGLNKNYDMIIANDFLEHIANPSDIVNKCWELCHEDSCFMVSIPNWRMNHDFIYRGLFDWDNFKYFMYIHGFAAVMVQSSGLHKTPKGDKLETESTLPDELQDAWNWYFLFKKITQDKAEEMVKKQPHRKDLTRG